MREYIRMIAISVSVAACFYIAIVGAIHKVDPLTCCYRAVCGSVFTYCVTTIVLQIIATIVLAALVDSQHKKSERSDNQ